MQYNNEFSVIDTEEKAYVLGQIYGDGYNSGKSPYKFSMASINTDTEMYNRIQTLFPFLKLKTFPSHENMIYLETHIKDFCLDLAKYGMISNKTVNDENGTFHFPKLRKDLIHHFIRGYFDADGSFYYPNRVRSRNCLHTEFGCATKNFLTELKEILKKEGIFFTYTERSKKAGNGKYYMSYILFSSNYDTSIKFADYIYKDATIYLQRKYETCYRPKQLRPTANEVFGNCPYCNSGDIWRSGIRNGKRRLCCMSCGKRFTRTMPTQEVILGAINP